MRPASPAFPQDAAVLDEFLQAQLERSGCSVGELDELAGLMRHCLLKSSDSAMSRSISGVMVKTGGNMAGLADDLADSGRL